MNEQFSHPELLTINEAERRLAIAHAFTQLDLVRRAFAEDQLQPNMGDSVVLHDVLPGKHFGYIIAPNPAFTVPSVRGSFAAGFNHRFGGWGSGQLGYEIDATQPEAIFKIGPPFEARELENIHNPSFPERAVKREATLLHRYSMADLQDKEMLSDYTLSFVRLASATYRYAARRLKRP